MIKKVVILVILAVAIYFAYPYAKEYLTFEFLKAQQSEFAAYYENNKLLVIAAYFFGYIAVTSLSVPGAAVITLGAGAFFGVVLGTVLVSFASSIGATLAFLVARYIIGDYVQEKYAKQLSKFNEQMAKEGAFYLFALRLIPAVPFFLINILMGATKIRAVTFYWVSQLGMLAGTIVFVNAGTQIAKIEQPKDILSPVLILSFVLLAIVPFAAKKVVEAIRKKQGKTEASASQESD